MNLVVLTLKLFDQPRNGGELCTARLLRGLEQAGHTLTVIGLGPAPVPPPGSRTRYCSVGPWTPAFADLPPAQRLALPLRAWAAGRPVTLQRLLGVDSARQVQRLLLDALPHMDGLVVNHLQALAWAQPLLHRLPAPMVVMHNLEAEGFRERARCLAGAGLRARASRWLLAREARLLQRLEDLALQHASVIGCLSAADARQLQAWAAQQPRAVAVAELPGYPLPQAGGPAAAAPDCGATTADAASRASAAGAAPQELSAPALRECLQALPAGTRRIGVLGTWTWEPNMAGLQWLLDEVLPLLPPHCQLILAGSGLERLPARPRTTVLGRIAEVASFYEAVDLVAIASVRGSGVHEKAIEAIGQGVPVVASRHGLRGLLAELPHCMPVADLSAQGPLGGLPPQVQLADTATDFALACAAPVAARDRAAARAWAAARQRAYQQVLQRCLGLALRAPGMNLHPHHIEVVS
ncbi:glycosyltransferase [Aquabacterium sp. OR-4]|uniref:glycosyltransferase n=1 Tax=Aquabacterium sp. OR-4 TaxID=2978127 RepID=UPI0021B40B27|nr:glycosyltransferase [Aquabacterium sp. OR-4]MDT7838925.1 glycosyltransferase [Aquabacterium sp. OR-4]